MTFARDNNSIPIVCMTPRKGETLTGSVTPLENHIYKIKDAVEISIDGVAIEYDAGSEICLEKGIIYIFSAEVQAHKM